MSFAPETTPVRKRHPGQKRGVVGRERGGRAEQRLVVGEHPGRAEGHVRRIPLLGGGRREHIWICRQEAVPFCLRGRGRRRLVRAEQEVAQRGQVVHLLVHLQPLIEHAPADRSPRRGSNPGPHRRHLMAPRDPHPHPSPTPTTASPHRHP